MPYKSLQSFELAYTIPLRGKLRKKGPMRQGAIVIYRENGGNRSESTGSEREGMKVKKHQVNN